jgi:hypothetical protein
VLNLPAAFRMGWNLILPFLDERTKAKIHILGPNVKLLQDYVPLSELEVDYGGKHEPYPRPDKFTEQMVKDGVMIKTGYFETAATRSATAGSVADVKEGGGLGRTLSAGRLDRIRQLLTRQTNHKAEQNTVKPSEVPKSHPRVTVLGATGKTGIEVVKRFLEKTDYDVTAFIRLQGSGGELTGCFTKINHGTNDIF